VDSENVALVRRVYELFNSLDPDPEVRRDSDTLRDLWDEWLSLWREHRSTIEEIRERGDRVLVVSNERFLPREGMEIENRGASIFTVRGGRIVRFEAYQEGQRGIDEFERS
jgi:ketosteroid isomerase-like protein